MRLGQEIVWRRIYDKVSHLSAEVVDVVSGQREARPADSGRILTPVRRSGPPPPPEHQPTSAHGQSQNRVIGHVFTTVSTVNILP